MGKKNNHHKKKPQDHQKPKTKKITLDTPYGEVRVRPMVMRLGFLRKNKHLNEQELMVEMLEEFSDAESLEILDQLDLATELEPVMEEWMEASGIAPGK